MIRSHVILPNVIDTLYCGNCIGGRWRHTELERLQKSENSWGLKTQTDNDATQHDKTRHCDAVSHSATQSHTNQWLCISGKKVKEKKWKGNLGGRVAGSEQPARAADGWRRAAGIWGMQGALDLTCRAGRRHLSRHHAHLKGRLTWVTQEGEERLLRSLRWNPLSNSFTPFVLLEVQVSWMKEKKKKKLHYKTIL